MSKDTLQAIADLKRYVDAALNVAPVVALRGSGLGGWTVTPTGLESSAGHLSIGDPDTAPTSATAGTGLWLDKTGLYGLLSNVSKTTISATTGKITAVDVDLTGTITATSGSFTGSITATSGSLSGLNISGNVTLTGSGVFRTAASGKRVEMSAAGGDSVDFYRSTGVLGGQIYGQTGYDIAVIGVAGVLVGAGTTLSLSGNGTVRLTIDTTINASAVLNMGGNQINMGTAKIVNLADPTGPQNAMTKAYADAHYVAI